MSRVVHFEIHAEQPERAMAFYRQCFGWEFTQWPGQEYWLAVTGPDSEPGINGGLIRRRGPIDGEAVIAYVCSIDVSSIEEAEKSVVQNGSTIVVPRMPLPGVGWLFYAKDTEGNILGVTQADPEAR